MKWMCKRNKKYIRKVSQSIRIQFHEITSSSARDTGQNYRRQIKNSDSFCLRKPWSERRLLQRNSKDAKTFECWCFRIVLRDSVVDFLKNRDFRKPRFAVNRWAETAVCGKAANITKCHWFPPMVPLNALLLTNARKPPRNGVITQS